MNTICQFYQFRCKRSSAACREFHRVSIAHVNSTQVNHFLFDPQLNLITFKFEHFAHGYALF